VNHLFVKMHSSGYLLPPEQYDVSLVVFHEVHGGQGASHVAGHEDAVLDQGSLGYALKPFKVVPELGRRPGLGEGLVEPVAGQG